MEHELRCDVTVQSIRISEQREIPRLLILPSTRCSRDNYQVSSREHFTGYKKCENVRERFYIKYKDLYVTETTDQFSLIIYLRQILIGIVRAFVEIIL